MHDFLEWFRLEEAFSIIALACILTFVGGQMTEKHEIVGRKAAWMAALAFLLYLGAGIHFWGIGDQTETVLIAMRACLAAAVTYGIGRIVFAITQMIETRIKMWKVTRKVVLTSGPPEPEEEIIEVEPVIELPPAIPTTREDLAVRARQRYEEKLALLDLRLVHDVARRPLVGSPRHRQSLKVLRLGRGEEVVDGQLRGRCAGFVDAGARSVMTGDDRDENECGGTMHDDLRTCK